MHLTKLCSRSVELKTPTVTIGGGIAPPRVMKHIARADSVAPKTTIGGGIAPPRVVQHIKRSTTKLSISKRGSN